MQAKLAFISSVSPKLDFMFTVPIDSPAEVDNYCSDLNKTLKDGHIEFVSFVKNNSGMHEVSHD